MIKLQLWISMIPLPKMFFRVSHNFSSRSAGEANRKKCIPRWNGRSWKFFVRIRVEREIYTKFIHAKPRWIGGRANETGGKKLGERGNIPKRFSIAVIHFHSLNFSFPFPSLFHLIRVNRSRSSRPMVFRRLLCVPSVLHTESIRAFLYSNRCWYYGFVFGSACIIPDCRSTNTITKRLRYGISNLTFHSKSIPEIWDSATWFLFLYLSKCIQKNENRKLWHSEDYNLWDLRFNEFQIYM